MSKPAQLYRHFDCADRLLYVGVSISAVVRLGVHNCESAWADEIARIEVETFPTREAALLAEKKAIKSENPVHNVQNNIDLKTDQMTLRCEPEFKADLDLIRKAEVDLPSRTEMLHRLVSREASQISDAIGWDRRGREAIGDTETPAEVG